MNILALDTADEVFSAALSSETGFWYIEADAGSRYSELIMECADSLCRMSGLSRGEINYVACMKGPGSFTGLRIGFSAAKGIALALGIPLTAVPTLDCLGYNLSVWPGIALPVIDAKQNRFFAALYRSGKNLTGYLDATPEAIAGELEKTRLNPKEPVILTGSGVRKFLPLLKCIIRPDDIGAEPCFSRGRAKELLEITKSGIMSKLYEYNINPVYLRKSDAELNR
jgi:tRNA threonylcarbamoyladenosine biosynthesis protein TsaB